MSRLIALDTETTGLHSKEGDRIIEIALVDVTRDAEPRHYHQLINPEGRAISESAIEVHGITDEMLLDKPTFAECLPDILEFIGDDATLVIHNAPFDVGFLRDECMNAGQVWKEVPVIDTMQEAIREFPTGSRVTLDALCNRFNVDLSSRVKHGALIDTIILAKLYLAWKGQSGLDLTAVKVKKAVVDSDVLGALNPQKVVVPKEVSATPPSTSWAKYFEGAEL
jgi:DNA polymerase-3 subunit epsilon